MFTAVQTAQSPISILFFCCKRKFSKLYLENLFSPLIVDCLNVQVFKLFMSSMPQPQLGFLRKTFVHSLIQRLRNPPGQRHHLFSDKFFQKQVKKFSVDHRAIKMINNLKTSVALSNDFVTSDRNAKIKLFHCLINNFVVGNAKITEFFQ